MRETKHPCGASWAVTRLSPLQMWFLHICDAWTDRRVGCVRTGSQRRMMNKRQIVSHAGFRDRSADDRVLFMGVEDRPGHCFSWGATKHDKVMKKWSHRGYHTWVSADCLFSFSWHVPLIADLHIKKTSLITINTSAVALVSVFSCIKLGMRYY